MRIVALLPVLLLFACGGGGGGGDDPVFDLNGWWEYASRDNGTTDPFVTSQVIPVSHTGTMVLLNAWPLTQQGNFLQARLPSDTDPDRTELSIDILSNDHLEGVYVVYEGGRQIRWADLRLLRVAAPTGTLSIHGTVGTTPISFDTTTAYASRSVIPMAPTMSIVVYANRVDGQDILLLQWPQIPPLDAGPYDAYEDLLVAGVRPDGMAAALASEGTVTVTSYTDDHVTGTYAFTLEGGGTVTGAFNVDILVKN